MRDMKMYENDDMLRGPVGVVLSVLEASNGELKIALDDVLNKSDGKRGDWSHKTFVTHKRYKKDDLLNLNLSEEEYASIGQYLLVRLMAAHKQSNDQND